MIAASEDNKGIVWLASYPKSGNTWLRVFLYHLIRIQTGAPREEDEINKLNRVSTYEGRLARMFTEYLGKRVEDASIEEVAMVRPAVQAAIRTRSKMTALVKTHNCIAEIIGFPLINFAATVGGIYMVRDPRDVALSLAHHLGAPLDEAIRVMSLRGFATSNTSDGPFEVWGSWSEHVASWTTSADESLLILRYEDLAADPIGKFNEIARHLRQNATPAAIAEATAASTFDQLAAAEKKTPFRETSERAGYFFREGKVGSWRKKMTVDQAKRIVADHGEQMRRHGYLTD